MIFATPSPGDLAGIVALVIAIAAALALPTITRSKRVQETLKIQGKANDELRKANADREADIARLEVVRTTDRLECEAALATERAARVDDHRQCEKQIAELEGKIKFAVDGDMAHIIADAVAHAIRAKDV